MIKIILFCLTVFILFYAGSCSSYHVEGFIKTDRNEIGIQDTLYMEAVVTDKVKPFDVMWDIYPLDSDAEIICPIPNDPENRFSALFIPRDTGEYQITIRFLYKNTAPRASDTVFLIVL